jgi:hypothetical protein
VTVSNETGRESGSENLGLWSGQRGCVGVWALGQCGRGSTQSQCAVTPMMAFGSVTDPVTAT